MWLRWGSGDSAPAAAYHNASDILGGGFWLQLPGGWLFCNQWNVVWWERRRPERRNDGWLIGRNHANPATRRPEYF